MAVNRTKFQKLKHGVGYEAALILADSAQNPQTAATVAAPAALTSTADQPGAYAEAEAQKIRDDIAALRVTLAALLVSLKAAGVVASS